MFIYPFSFLVIFPGALIIWILKWSKTQDVDETKLLKASSEPWSKATKLSLLFSGAAAPWFIAVTTLQETMLGNGLPRSSTFAQPFIFDLIPSILLALVGLFFWIRARKAEGKNYGNYWAMRLVIVNVILAPFALVLALIFAIGRAK